MTCVCAHANRVTVSAGHGSRSFAAVVLAQVDAAALTALAGLRGGDDDRQLRTCATVIFETLAASCLHAAHLALLRWRPRMLQYF